MPTHADHLAKFRQIVGDEHVLSSASTLEPLVNDWRGRYHGSAACAVLPANTDEVAQIVRYCVAHQLPMLPQGGNTSLCGAATPDASGQTVIISLVRLNQIRHIDPANLSMTVEAGCTLEAVQAGAKEAGYLFPLSLPSEKLCRIGGNLSTNAGGVQVLRYGNTRELTLGLEAVLPNGDIWHGLKSLRKDNTGYDLKQLLIGAEGTLGIITAAVLKLFPLPQQQVTVWLNPPTPQAAIEILNAAQAQFSGELTAFELVSDVALSLVLKHFPEAKAPTDNVSPWMVLCEFSATRTDEPLQVRVTDFLRQLEQTHKMGENVIAQDTERAQALWLIRKKISDAQKAEGFSIKHDISVPVSAIPTFLQRAGEALNRHYPGIRIVAFGHAGDGNLHYNLSFPAMAGDRGSAFLAHQTDINRIVHDLVAELDGSIAAEHGLGQLKRDELKRYKPPVELAAMRAIKNALDPLGLMNPGKLL